MNDYCLSAKRWHGNVVVYLNHFCTLHTRDAAGFRECLTFSAMHGTPETRSRFCSLRASKDLFLDQRVGRSRFAQPSTRAPPRGPRRPIKSLGPRSRRLNLSQLLSYPLTKNPGSLAHSSVQNKPTAKFFGTSIASDGNNVWQSEFVMAYSKTLPTEIRRAQLLAA